MSGENRKFRKKGRFHRWMAVALTMALLVGQGNVSVLAEEENVPVEIETEGGEAAGSQGENTDDGNDGADSENEDTFENGGDAAGDGNGKEEGGDAADDGNGKEEGDAADDGNGKEEGGDAADDGNGKEESGDATDGRDEAEGDDGVSSDSEDKGTPCICEVKCKAEIVNEECPVCALEYDACVGITEEGQEIPEEIPAEEIAPLADEDVEAYEVGDTFWDENGVRYYVIEGNKVALIAYKNKTEAAGALEIPQTVTFAGVEYQITQIGEKVFNNYDGLTHVKIPDGVTKIGKDAFKGCTNLTGIEMPDSLWSIEGSAFSGCTNLVSINIPDGVTSIGSYAFAFCSSLESIKISEKLAGIAEGLFKSCKNLKHIKIPENVTIIWGYAFQYCDGLTSIELSDGIMIIGEYAFQSCAGLTGIELPDSVRSIGEYAFSGCSNLESIEIPYGVESIETMTFSSCSSLSEVVIPNSVTGIETSAFQSCTGLTKIELPDSVTRIWHSAFSGCSQLSSINLPESLRDIGNSAFNGCGLTEVTIPAGTVNRGAGIFSHCKKLESATIPNTLGSINVAFNSCSSLTTLRIVVSAQQPDAIPTVFSRDFSGLPRDRTIVFLAEDGTALTGDALAAAQRAFKADKTDGNTVDNMWWGWKLGDVPAIPDTPKTYHVALDVFKDDALWRDHGKRFMLRSEGDDTLVESSEAVTAGTYLVYDVTGTADAEWLTKGVNTGVTVTVTDQDASAAVYYYTVTFCDDDGAEYGADTAQGPRTVLKTNGRVAVPEAPTKTGYTFEKWVTTPGGDDEFNFASAAITARTKIYAKWIQNTIPVYTVTIKVKKDGELWSGHGRRFALLPEGGGFITDLVRVPNGSYRIYDITGVSADSLYSGARDTGVDVRVNGVDTEVSVTVADGPAEAEIRYYTVTFYDGADAYGAGTPQEPQIVLQNKKAARPADPSKTDYQFAGWKTADGVVPYDFESAVTDATGIYASWIEKAAKQLHIAASAEEGGTISPAGDISVTEGGELTFTITPNEGNRIKAVTVDGRDVTGELADNVAKAQTGAKYYTFTNITENHTILASFESSGSTPGGDDNPNPGGGSGTGGSTPGGGDNPNPGGGSGTGGSTPGGDSSNPGGGSGTGGSTPGGDDNPNPGGGSGTGGSTPGGGDNPNPGGGSGTGGSTPGGDDNPNPGGGSGTGGSTPGGNDNPNPGSGSGTGGSPNSGGSDNSGGGNGTGGDSNQNRGNSAGNVQVTAISETASAPAGNGAADNTGTAKTSAGQESGTGSTAAPDSEAAAAGVSAGASGQTADKTEPAAGGTEPKTGDTTYIEIYATMAMIAGLTYLLLCFMEEGRGMTEREKDVFVAAFIRWGKKGGAFRKACAVVAIFCLLAYYHSMGKRTYMSSRECLRQAL